MNNLGTEDFLIGELEIRSSYDLDGVPDEGTEKGIKWC
jgi:hypothetical protein